MALIGTLRNKMGAGVVIFVFVAIASFILSDLLGSKSSFLNKNDVGEIAGHTVSLDEYQQMVREQEQNYFLSYNREATERDKPLLQQQAWELLILKYAIQKQFDKVGVEVTSEEVWDMIQGKNIDQNVKQAFTNPKTGAFEKDKVVSYLSQLKAMQDGSEARVRWEMFEKNLRPGRQRIKYENLVIKTNYITTAEAEKEYHNQTDVAEVKYLYVPYYAVSDSTVKVSDEQLKDYYNRNKEKYKTEHTRDLSYVSVPVVPSADDTLEIKNEFQKIANDFVTAENDSAFAAANTDGQSPYSKYTPSNLPAFVSKDDLVVGKIIGPVLDGQNYKLIKISKITTDTIYSAKASHILVKWTSDTDVAKKEAKERAQNILKELKGGADFATKARTTSEDPGSGSRGGDLGWFSTGQMVKPFQDAVFSASKTGLINNIIESQFGYHIINVTNLKNNTAYYITLIERSITPSDATTNEAYRKAETFASGLSGVTAFIEKAKKEGLSVMDANALGASERRVGNLGEARQIVQWLFREASVGKVSEVFDLRDEYVIAIMTGELEKGYKPFEKVKLDITPGARNEEKGKQIIEKLNGLKGSLDEMAKAFGTDANVYSNSDLKLSANSLTFGVDAQAVGLAFSLETGKRSKPFASENGVVIFESGNKTIAPAVADYAPYKTKLEQDARNSSTYNIATVIKENSDIDDKRYKLH